MRGPAALLAALVFALALMVVCAPWLPAGEASLGYRLGPLVQRLWLSGLLVASGVPLGLGVSLVVWGGGLFRRRLVQLACLAVLAISPAVTMAGLRLALRPWGHAGDEAPAQALCQMATAAALACLIVTARLDRLDRLVLRVAAVQGSHGLGAFRRVVLPHLGWSLVLAEAAAGCLPLVRS